MIRQRFLPFTCIIMNQFQDSALSQDSVLLLAVIFQPLPHSIVDKGLDRE